MGQPFGMQGLHSVHHRKQQTPQAGLAERAVALDVGTQRLPVDILHHIVCRIVGLEYLVDADDIWMRHPYLLKPAHLTDKILQAALNLLANRSGILYTRRVALALTEGVEEMLLDGELGLDFDVLYGYCGRGPVGDPESTAPRTDTTVYVRSELASTVPAGRAKSMRFSMYGHVLVFLHKFTHFPAAPQKSRP